MNIFVLSYNFSAGANALHFSLLDSYGMQSYYFNISKQRRENHNQRREDQNTRLLQRSLNNNFVIINWGSKSIPPILSSAKIILNPPESVAITSSKIKTLALLSSINPKQTPEWTTNINIAKTWFPSLVYCRTYDNSSQGKGIILTSDETQLIPAPLYTKYTKAKHEFRVHFTENEIFSIKRKARRKYEYPENNEKYIKNRKNGWILIDVQNVDIINKLTNALSPTLKKYCALSKLNFGAADISYNELKDTFTILEINTAPGIQNSTINLYADNLLSLLNYKTSLQNQTNTDNNNQPSTPTPLEWVTVNNNIATQPSPNRIYTPRIPINRTNPDEF